MIYKDFKGKKLSALGFGCMRFPTIEDDGSKIDEASTGEMIDYAIKNGINYFDTAWGYHGGNSEIVVGKLLSKYPRDSYYLATKFPGYDLANMNKAEEIFERQLEKTGADYFDFYLFHNVCERNIDGFLNPEYKILDYLLEQKKNGRIRHLGFSAHGVYETMKRFLDAYGEHLEFCQIQLNWIDWELQGAKQKVELLKEYNIPVWVMEPLRGGKLAEISPEDTAELIAMRPDEKIPAWAFRFIENIPEVTMVLSGMSTMEQLKENIATFSSAKPLNEKENEKLLSIARKMTTGVPCTACSYCTEYCPQGLNIPRLISLYNQHKFSGGGFLISMALDAMGEDKQPSSCIGCKSCEAVCPQGIKISEVLSDFSERLKS
ncbi:MAG: aldo/keto reductase [Clostridia bacterium]|nr:aldo/keto reductase [Clostridia bacterium]